MYQKPTLQQYGTFRALTLGGGAVPTDIFTPQNANDGCIQLDPNNILCKKS